ncbi:MULTISPECIES: reverse transcriptase domain-containing protein [unclassified Parasaccharibacter]|uniref:reverse transcriptase domain-containing protein n=1 Tax=unclassified Parasaccharibacter TaxID=2626400 RepID=UPI00200AA603|nr:MULTISPECIES: reverse transcriptase domain-containing protein [unclassified Parasaccharibacter]
MSQSARQELASLSRLEFAWKQIWRKKGAKTTPGVDGVSATTFKNERMNRLREIQSNIRDGYKFSLLRGVAIPKTDPKKLRLICIPTLSDRIVQRALVNKIEEQAEKLGLINPVSYGFIRNTENQNRGVRGAQKAACALREKKPWVFKADIAKFFDRINRKELAEKFSRQFKLRSLTPLVLGAIQCEVAESSEKIRKATIQNGIQRGRGLRQGMPLSPILSNFVLKDFDRVVGAQYSMVRYADDLLIFTDTESQCIEARKKVEEELKIIGHELSEEKSHIYSPSQPVDFLGMALARQENGKCYFYVSPEQIREIKKSISEYHDISWLISQDKDIGYVLRRINFMKNGYLSAYDYASNSKDLKNQLEQAVQKCVNVLYGTIFGRDAVQNLSNKYRKFLMLP